jgi:ABC-type uncharacterized transport system permease subunit
MHHPHQRLAGRQAANHFLAKGFFFDAGDEIAHHRQGDIGFQERHADLAQHLGRVGFGQARLAFDGFDRFGQALSEIVKHAVCGSYTYRVEIVYALTALIYFACGLRAAQLVVRAKGPLQLHGWDAWLPWLAVALHAVLLVADVDVPEGLRFGFAQALSLLLLIGVTAFLIEERYVAISAMRPFVLGTAAVVAPLTFHFAGTIIRTPHPALTLHLWLAMAAYSLIGVAALHALYMVVVERGLHSGSARAMAGGTSKLSIFMRMLTLQAPPLVPMERLLFKLIGVGFAVLTAALALGVWLAVSESAKGLRFDHKTVFSVLAWLVLAALLLGRWISGWRGRTAIRWTLTGFAMLSLAYVGSRFVFEALLHRTS